MNFSKESARAKSVWFDDCNIWISLVDGRQLSVPKAYFPNLENASASDLERSRSSASRIPFSCRRMAFSSLRSIRTRNSTDFVASVSKKAFCFSTMACSPMVLGSHIAALPFLLFPPIFRPRRAVLLLLYTIPEK